MQLLEISSEGLLAIYVFTGLISLLLLGITISTAIRVNKRDRHSRIIIELLAHIAEKDGVEKRILDDLVDQSRI